MSQNSHQTPPVRRVLMLGYENAQVIDIAGPMQIFTNALGPDGKPAYAAEIVAPKPGPMKVDPGMLRNYIGLTEAGFVSGSQPLAIVDSPLA